MFRNNFIYDHACRNDEAEDVRLLVCLFILRSSPLKIEGRKTKVSKVFSTKSKNFETIIR